MPARACRPWPDGPGSGPSGATAPTLRAGQCHRHRRGPGGLAVRPGDPGHQRPATAAQRKPAQGPGAPRHGPGGWGHRRGPDQWCRTLRRRVRHRAGAAVSAGRRRPHGLAGGPGETAGQRHRHRRRPAGGARGTLDPDRRLRGPGDRQRPGAPGSAPAAGGDRQRRRPRGHLPFPPGGSGLPPRRINGANRQPGPCHGRFRHLHGGGLEPPAL